MCVFVVCVVYMEYVCDIGLLCIVYVLCVMIFGMCVVYKLVKYERYVVVAFIVSPRVV